MFSVTRTSPALREKLRRFLHPRPPRRLARRFRSITAAQRTELSRVIRDVFISDAVFSTSGIDVGEYCDTEEGKEDLDSHLLKGIDTARMCDVPWLDDARRLAGARVLELGCGTGNLTVALAEQGARVTAIDIHEPSVTVAGERCRLYGVEADIRNGNATRVADDFGGESYEFIIFSQSLEHMLLDERLTALAAAWDMLDPGGLLVIVQAPNRLWYFDAHTSGLPFFHWLPDDLAFRYTAHSPRPHFSTSYREQNLSKDMTHFLRQGRGVSFHEVELAFGPLNELRVVSSRDGYRRRRSPVWWLLWRLTNEYRFQRLLASVGPALHPGFYEQSLDIIIEKVASAWPARAVCGPETP